MQTPVKIFNDPVHGFIEIPRGLILDLINHPYLQRLRRIKQLALSSFVYPGAEHTRFNHVIGAMHLTRMALDTLKFKGIEISDEEYQATLIAILLHDLGHGPFSHALEHVIIPNLKHEIISLELMNRLNQQFRSELSLAIKIFTGQYPKAFLHQLVSSQLDMDRMDYLMRDSFFTGVSEGVVGADRIIKTLYVNDNQLVVEEKGIYSIEKFIVARRLMYWQVYLHKTVLSAENLMVKVLKRAKTLFLKGNLIFIPDNLAYFMSLDETEPPKMHEGLLGRFVNMEDADIWIAIKQWQFEQDKILSDLAKRLITRKLFKLTYQKEPVSESILETRKSFFQQQLQILPEDIDYYVFSGKATNLAYLQHSEEPILIYYKSGEVKDIATASDLANIEAMSSAVTKYFICSPDY